MPKDYQTDYQELRRRVAQAEELRRRLDVLEQNLFELLKSLPRVGAVKGGCSIPTLGGHAPVGGAPSFWMSLDVDGTTRYFPVW